jgi:hypothetical protein
VSNTINKLLALSIGVTFLLFNSSCSRLIIGKKMNCLNGKKEKVGLWIEQNEKGFFEIKRYKKDKPDGIVRIYDKENGLVVKGKYKKGIKVGKWVGYSKRSPYKIVRFDKGVPHLKRICDYDDLLGNDSIP